MVQNGEFESRLGLLTAVDWMVILYMGATLSYPLEYYGTRWMGLDLQTARQIVAITDAVVIVLRCGLAVAIVHAEVTAVANEASKAQQYKREAADARLDTIQQFTRYIFHEARVPLQAVSLAVDELQETVKEASLQARELEGLGTGMRRRRGEGTAGRLVERGGGDGEAAGAAADGDASPRGRVLAALMGTLHEAREVLESQKEGCKGLQHIFDDVLEAQRIEQGRLKLRDDDVNLGQVLRDIRTVFRRSASGKGVDLHTAVGLGVPGLVRGDGLRMKQVVANLVSNAIKFTPEGGRIDVLVTSDANPSQDRMADDDEGILVSAKGAWSSVHAARAAPDQQSGSNEQHHAGSDKDVQSYLSTASGSSTIVRITVTDTGCGMSAQDVAGLFSPYKQARHGVAYTGSSSGLGLYISRGIARQMGGDLTASSDGDGLGSRFEFWFRA